MRKYYIHVSFDEVEEFIPRVPSNRCEGEDDAIPRICCSTSVKGALRAIPGAGAAVKNLLNAGIEPIIHVYLLHPRHSCVIHNLKVREYVPDANETDETWLVKTPAWAVRRDYKIVDPVIETVNEYPYISECKLKRVRNQNNWEVFWNHFRPDTSMPDRFKMLGGISFRTVADNLNGNFLKQLINVSRPETVINESVQYGKIS